MPMEQFSQHLLPSLLSLSSDPVANVRVLVAKALRQSVMEKGAHASHTHTGSRTLHDIDNGTTTHASSVYIHSLQVVFE